MSSIRPYDRQKAFDYAAKWALSRNPRYFSFDGIGGDCTNFISQCLYAGGGIMNYKKDVGWYYNSAADRAAAWSGVPYLYRFLTGNRGPGPFAKEVSKQALEIGDVIQLGNTDGHWYHSLLVTGLEGSGPLVSTHTFDAHLRPLYTYQYGAARFLHVEGFRAP